MVGDLYRYISQTTAFRYPPGLVTEVYDDGRFNIWYEGAEFRVETANYTRVTPTFAGFYDL